jgi:hypothetical protein
MLMELALEECGLDLFDVDGIVRQQGSTYPYPLFHGKGRHRGVLAEEVS